MPSSMRLLRSKSCAGILADILVFRLRLCYTSTAVGEAVRQVVAVNMKVEAIGARDGASTGIWAVI